MCRWPLPGDATLRRFPSLLLPLSLGLVLTATSCDPDGPGGSSGDDAGNELPDSGSDAGNDTDAGSDAGTTDAGSDAGAEEPGDPCTAAEPQPAECAYGSSCGSRATCQTVPVPTCANFNKFPVSWDPATSTGPVTYAAELLSLTANDPDCIPQLPTRFRIRIRAYSPSSGLPTTVSELSQAFSYVNPNGSYLSESSQFSGIVTSGDGKNTEFVVSNCIVDQPTVSLGFYFEGGNGLCQLVSR